MVLAMKISGHATRPRKSQMEVRRLGQDSDKVRPNDRLRYGGRVLRIMRLRSAVGREGANFAGREPRRMGRDKVRGPRLAQLGVRS
jgi:hypothetical protein